MIRGILGGLLVTALLSGCATGVQEVRQPEQVEAQDAIAEPKTSEEESKSPPPSWTQPASPSPAEACRVIDGQPEEARLALAGTPFNGKRSRGNIGFPLSPGSLPVEGKANFVAVMVGFQDAPPTNTDPEAFLRPQVDKMTEWSEFWSQGKLSYRFQLVDDWITLPVNHADYPVGSHVDYRISRANATEVIKMVTASLPADLDYENLDGVLAYWAPGIHSFRGDLALRGYEGVPLPFPVGDKQIGFWSGNNYHHTTSGNLTPEKKAEFTWSFWSYLLLFAQGLHNHGPGNGWPVGIQQIQESAGKFSGAINGWDVFKLGWLEDTQVHCMEPDVLDVPSEFILQSREISGGEKRLAIVPFVDKGAIVIESRRPVDWSESWDKDDSGLLVYFVDTELDVERVDEFTRGGCGPSEEDKKWAYFLYKDGFTGDCRSFSNAFIREGDALTFESIQIELVHSAEAKDYVRVQSISPSEQK